MTYKRSRARVEKKEIGLERVKAKDKDVYHNRRALLLNGIITKISSLSVS